MIQGTLPFSFFGLSLTTVYGCALQVEPQTPHCKKKAVKSIHSVSILSSFSFPRVSTLGDKGRHGKQATFSLFFCVFVPFSWAGDGKRTSSLTPSSFPQCQG